VKSLIWTFLDRRRSWGFLLSRLCCWRPRRDLNPCYRRERWPRSRSFTTLQHSEVHRKASYSRKNTVTGPQLVLEHGLFIPDFSDSERCLDHRNIGEAA
jgi:hypothetical protein